MISYFTLAYKKYAEFTGRSTRSEYWYFYLTYFIIGIALGLLTFIPGARSFSILSFIFSLATLIPHLAIMTRRMHDIGKSGWNILWLLLPIVGWIYFIVLLCTKSQPGDNAYGPNPWGQSPVAAMPASPVSDTPQNPVQ